MLAIRTFDGNKPLHMCCVKVFKTSSAAHSTVGWQMKVEPTCLYNASANH